MGMSNTYDDVNVTKLVNKEVENHKGWFFGSGIVLLALGALAIIFPAVASISLEIFIGALFVASGAVGLFHSLRLKGWKGHTFSLVNSLLALGLGILLLAFPMEGLISLTVLIGAFFLISGIFKMALAFGLRPLDNWAWSLIGGIISLALGLIILVVSPQAPWVLGILVGVDFIMAGATFLTLSLKI